MSGQNPLVVATSNPGKAREYADLLPPGSVTKTLVDLGIRGPMETGQTFAENATIKAVAVSSATEYLVLADDSGLMVDALGGLPGVRSARFAGEDASDQRNNRLLLTSLAGAIAGDRAAKFVCAIVVAQRGEVLLSAEGVCEGTIAFAPRGSSGFGYDSLFTLPDGMTMAELSPQVKNLISHRAIAFRAVAGRLADLMRKSSPREPMTNG